MRTSMNNRAANVDLWLQLRLQSWWFLHVYPLFLPLLLGIVCHALVAFAALFSSST